MPARRCGAPRPRTWTPCVGPPGLHAGTGRGALGVSVATLRHWERGDRNPQGPALVRLNLIDRDPAGLLQALS